MCGPIRIKGHNYYYRCSALYYFVVTYFAQYLNSVSSPDPHGQ
jgi:hypothetical protein